MKRSFKHRFPCHATELVKFRQRIGVEGVKRIFGLSVDLHDKAAEEATVLVDTTVQEKAITYPTDSKHRVKPIKLAVVDRGYRGARKHIPKDGVEIGRIVETPRDTLENDILKITSGQEYKHSYHD